MGGRKNDEKKVWEEFGQFKKGGGVPYNDHSGPGACVLGPGTWGEEAGGMGRGGWELVTPGAGSARLYICPSVEQQLWKMWALMRSSFPPEKKTFIAVSGLESATAVHCKEH